MDMTMKSLMVRTKANDVDEKGRVTVAVNRTGIEDSQGDISMPGSFDVTLREDISRMKWLKDHDVTRLLGVPLEGREKDGDIIMVGQLNMEKQMCRDVYTDYKLMAQYGRTLEHSVGVIPVRRDKADRRKVHQWKMLEYSTLSFLGSNPCTYMVDLKTATPDRVRQAVELLQKALCQPEYSDVRLKDMDSHLTLLLRKLNGGRIVTCPHCGHTFDYDAMDEHSFSEDVLDCASRYLDWMVADTVREHISALRPEIQAEVSNLLDAVAANGLTVSNKSITSLMSWVSCPKCWHKVYSAAIGSDSSATKTEEVDPEKPDETQDETTDEETTDSNAPEKRKTFGALLSGIVTKI